MREKERERGKEKERERETYTQRQTDSQQTDRQLERETLFWLFQCKFSSKGLRVSRLLLCVYICKCK